MIYFNFGHKLSKSFLLNLLLKAVYNVKKYFKKHDFFLIKEKYDFLIFKKFIKKWPLKKICLIYNCLVQDNFIKLVISESCQPSSFSGHSGYLKFYKMSV